MLLPPTATTSSSSSSSRSRRSSSCSPPLTSKDLRRRRRRRRRSFSLPPLPLPLLLLLLLLPGARRSAAAFVLVPAPSFQTRAEVGSSPSTARTFRRPVTGRRTIPAPPGIAATREATTSTSSSTSTSSTTAEVKKHRRKRNKPPPSTTRSAAPAGTGSGSSSGSSSSTVAGMAARGAAAAAAAASAAAKAYPKFSELKRPLLHPLLAGNLARNFDFDRTTEIQARTWVEACAGRDVLARARTGTGKTLSFLLPSMQRLLPPLDGGDGGGDNGNRSRHPTIRALVLSPTRELAAQIGDQAWALSGGNEKGNENGGGTGISHQVVFGGTAKAGDVRKFERCIPSVLVATPGRLRDHLQTTRVRGTPFAQLLSRTSILVLDETDRLLDMGFRRDVEDIISYLPSKRDRQTLLFSATVPPEVRAVMAATMKPDYVTVDCIHDGDPASHTNAQVEQRHVVVSSKDRLVTGTLDILCKLIRDAEIAGEPLKLVAFFNTANLVAHYAELFNAGLGIPVLELHSRKSQSYRTRTADEFRSADSAILFTSDVSARGVDYPGVTNVVQFGIADSRESYIHRLGRTGRAGRVGEGLLVLTELETNFLRTLKGLDVPEHEEFQSLVDGPPSPAVAAKLEPLLASIRGGGHKSIASSARSAYRSMLGFYNGKLPKLMNVKGTGPLVDFANDFALQSGLAEIPQLEQKTVKKMGLSKAEGLNVVKNGAGRGEGGGQGRGGGGGGHGDRGHGGRVQQRVGVGGGGRGDSNFPRKRRNSVASDVGERARSAKKPKWQGGGGGRGPLSSNQRRHSSNSNKAAASRVP